MHLSYRRCRGDNGSVDSNLGFLLGHSQGAIRVLHSTIRTLPQPHAMDSMVASYAGHWLSPLDFRREEANNEVLRSECGLRPRLDCAPPLATTNGGDVSPSYYALHHGGRVTGLASLIQDAARCCRTPGGFAFTANSHLLLLPPRDVGTHHHQHRWLRCGRGQRRGSRNQHTISPLPAPRVQMAFLVA